MLEENRIKFRLNRLGDPPRSDHYKALREVLQALELNGFLPIMPDQTLAGNAAVWDGTLLWVTRSQRIPGHLNREDFVAVAKFDPLTWTANFYSTSPEIHPSSDTPLHWLSLKEAPELFNWNRRPKFTAHGHVNLDIEDAKTLNWPMANRETEFSTPEDRNAFLELLRDFSFPQHDVYIRKGHGFFLLAENSFDASHRTLDVIAKLKRLR